MVLLPLTSYETQVLDPQRCQQTAQARVSLIGPASRIDRLLIGPGLKIDRSPIDPGSKIDRSLIDR